MTNQKLIIDSHHHWIPAHVAGDIPRYLRPGETIARDRDGFRIMRGGLDLFRVNPSYTDIQFQLKEMDAVGIDLAVLSTACLQQWNTISLARKINDAMAELQAKYPHRLLGLAHVPPFEEGAVMELERAVKGLGLKGVSLTTHFDGRYPDDKGYDPLFRKAEDLGVPIVFHAATHPAEDSLFKKYGLIRSLGRLVDHTLAVADTLYTVAKKFPKLKFLHAHLGGSFIIMKDRLLDVDWFGVESQPYDEILDRQFFFDTGPARWQPDILECAMNCMGCNHILLGSDYPVKSQFLPDSVNAIKQMRISDEEKSKILGENALALFNL